MRERDEDEVEIARRDWAQRFLKVFLRQLVVLVVVAGVYAAEVWFGHHANPLKITGTLQMSYAVIFGLIWLIIALAMSFRFDRQPSVRPVATALEAARRDLPPVRKTLKDPLAEDPADREFSEDELAAFGDVPPAGEAVHHSVRAAREGQESALVHMARLAQDRGRLFEAYYWLTLVNLHGKRGLELLLEDLRHQIVAEGFPPDEEMYTGTFDERACSFAHAALDFETGFARPQALSYFQALAAEGDVDAILFCERRFPRPGGQQYPEHPEEPKS